MYNKSQDPHINAIMSYVDFSKSVEKQALAVRHGSFALYADDISKNDKSKAMKNLAIYLRDNYPNLAHHALYAFNNDKIDKSIYDTPDTARVMSLKCNFPQYQNAILWDIKCAIGCLPNKEPDFAIKELALRVTLKSLLESDKYDEFYWYDYIRTVFNKENKHVSEHEQLRKEAKKIYKEYCVSAFKCKSKEAMFSRGYYFGKFMQGYDIRTQKMTSYVANSKREKNINYGSAEMNYFMRQPLSFPEYGSASRELIKGVHGFIPWGDKYYPYIELVMRYIFAIRKGKNYKSAPHTKRVLQYLLEDANDENKEPETLN